MKFHEILELMKYLVNLKEGTEAYQSFYNSIINDFIQCGYSEERATQVLDEMVDNFIKKYGKKVS